MEYFSIPRGKAVYAAAWVAIGFACAAGAPAAEVGDLASRPERPIAPTTANHGRLPVGNSEEFRRGMLTWTRPDQIPVPSAVEREETFDPIKLVVSSPFGWRSDPIKGGKRRHDGIDLPAYSGAGVYATGAGIVRVAGWISGYGNLVEISHSDGVRTRYGHLSRIIVSPGAAVTQGQRIGSIGSTGRSTGPHLHYEVRAAGAAVNPQKYLGQTIPIYEAKWTPEAVVAARWTGWQRTKDDGGLPRATIR